MRHKKLYGYLIDGELCALGIASIITEMPLPKRSTRFNEICCGRNTRPLPKRVCRVGTEIDIVWGDPVVLRGCTTLSSKKNPAPQGAELMSDFFYDVIVVRYRHGRIWMFRCDSSLITEAERVRARLKKERAAREAKKN